MSLLTGKKVLMVIASNGYRDEELEEPRSVLKANGAEVILASSSLDEAKGVLGGKTKPDILISNVKAGDFDGVVFVGGGGSSEYWQNPAAHRIAKDTYNLGKVISAICIAPVTLANTGILKGKRATVYHSEAEKLKSAGVIYTGRGVETDGNVVTADGPGNARKFGETLVEKLQKHKN